jgi:hypothetical protein
MVEEVLLELEKIFCSHLHNFGTSLWLLRSCYLHTKINQLKINFYLTFFV